MPKHALPGSEGQQWRAPIRDSVLVMIGLTVIVSLLLGSYASAFGNPKPRDIPVAVVGPAATRAKLDASPALEVRTATSAQDATRLIEDRHVYGALLFTAPGQVTLLTAGGAGHSVQAALLGVAAGIASQGKLDLHSRDVAPLGSNDPNGTIEFYCVLFLTIGAALGSTLLGRVLGAVRSLSHLLRRTVALVVLSAVLAAANLLVADPIVGALVGHPGYLFLAFWAYTLTISLACSGVSALLGSFAGIALTLLLTILGNTSAGGAVGRPLLNPFFSALNPIFPHGAGIEIVRDVQYFGGRGIGANVLCLAVWAAVGVLMHVTFAARRGRSADTLGRHDPGVLPVG